MPKTTTPSPAEIREELETLVIADLLGPKDGREEEVDETRVSDRYLVGMLAPQEVELGAEQDDEFATGSNGTGEEGAAEPTNMRSGSMFPSSMGMTFVVDGAIDEIAVEARWGRYEHQDSEFLVETKKRKKKGKKGTAKKKGEKAAKGEKDDEEFEEYERPKRIWKRSQVIGQIAGLRLQEGPIAEMSPSSDHPEVVVKGIARKREGNWIVTLFLVNGQFEADANKDSVWLFQAELIVAHASGKAIFLQRPALLGHDQSVFDDEQEMAMLYRRQVEFGVGHGVAVHAESSDDDCWKAVRVRTTAVPVHEVLQQTPPTEKDKGFEKLKGLVLDMKELAEANPADLPAMLTPLVNAYENWIKTQREKPKNPDEKLEGFEDALERSMDKCEDALRRIKAGIARIKSDQQACDAFQFANRAMWLQRVHSIMAEKVRRNEDATFDSVNADSRNRSWYPFQLAFLLLNIPGSTDFDHPERSDPTDAFADLLWFPTGGGKTEAYLGLAAYVMGLRRLQGMVEGYSSEKGMAVLMRYTLRLLTLQQFQRATALICACEYIRRNSIAAGEGKWGTELFRIGLWVGQRATPNSTKQSAESIEREHGTSDSYQSGGVGSPAQLTNCPWCGSPIKPGRDIHVESFKGGRGRTIIYCSDPLSRCLFSQGKSPDEGLPVVVVDEEIYRLLPTLVIATVDKFAQLPWNGRTQMLFGRVNGYCTRHGFRSPEVLDTDSHPKRKTMPAAQTLPHPLLRPPDLIIQDELHLISGPLGSLVGLYETAIDELCSWTFKGKRVRPKVIASTATIRNASAQVRALFLRRVEIFPPPGTDVTDNFFSIQRGPEEKPGRRYLGICAPGRRLKAALIRVYVAHLSAAQLLYQKYGRAADPWMTLVGYFNSLRELGGMRRLIDDDVRNRLRRMDSRGLAKRNPPFVEEMTSRKASTDIPVLLDRLEAVFDPKLEKERKIAAKTKKSKFTSMKPLDVLLATNMISVGVDVKRLGLMIAAGQPKATAEYIQATSRVGRSAPGLVCTVYNWARPRDLSHYERFEHYHGTFYQQVEALSVTPFAARARDRGLTALLVTLIRLEGERFNENGTAAAVTRDDVYVKRAIATIVKRIENVMNSKDLGEEVRKALEKRIDAWLAMAGKSPTLGYRYKKDGTTVPLLRSADGGEWELFSCLNSLRDVEPSARLMLIDDGLS